MRTRTLLTPALVASLALLSSPVLADDETGDPANDVTEECPAPEAIVAGTLEQAAQAAAAAAERLAEGDTCLSDESELATDALQAAVDRLSADDADSDGVAALVLQALINGESPEGIGAAHGAAVSQAARERRPEHVSAKDRADTADAAEASDVRATPAVPALPATPAAPEAPATPAVPAVPAVPATPAVPAPPADLGETTPPEAPGRPATPGRP